MAAIDWTFWTGTFAGILTTVVVGIPPIIFALRRRYPGQLTYFREPPVRLLDDITGNLTDLTVSYKGKPVQKNITLLRGFLVNTGNKDITNEMVTRSLSFELPEGCQWLAASAKSQQDKEDHVAITGPKSVVFSLGLFRCNEYFRFERLIEVTGAKERGDVILREHRIADTGKVGWKPLPKKLSQIEFWMALAFSVSLLVLGIGCLAFPSPTAGKDTPFLRMMGFLLSLSGTYALSILIIFGRRSRKIRELLKLDAE
jgi:hypothetical protein